jgi:hypothetical protein
MDGFAGNFNQPAKYLATRISVLSFLPQNLS